MSAGKINGFQHPGTGQTPPPPHYQEVNSINRESEFWRAFGPGIIFAGSCVGVSHLVQSTRAGGLYGLALVTPILLALALKYPAFRFATQYTASTGKTLVEGYRNLGRQWLWLYILFISLTAVFATAAISLVTAALGKAAFGLDIPDKAATVLTMFISALLVAVGHFQLLERIMKFFVLLFTVLTLFAVALILPDIDLTSTALFVPKNWTLVDFAFLVAVLGWMPTPIDAAVQQSLWTSAKMKSAGNTLSTSALIMDFNVGYIATAVLAVCFVVMGAGLIFGSGTELPDRPADFGAMVIHLYEQSIGDWIGPLIGVCAFAVMFSTMLSIFDGMPRTFGTVAVLLLYGADYEELDPRLRHTWFNVSIGLICVLVLAVLFFFMQSFKTFIDLVTTVSFLIAPIIAWMNHRAITSPEVPVDERPSALLLAWNCTGIVTMVLMACALLYFSLID